MRYALPKRAPRALEHERFRDAIHGVGDRYVLEEMLASGYSLGGEQSGHIIARDYATTGDGILSSLLISRMVKESGRSLTDLTSFIQRLPQTLINVGGVDRAAASTNEAVAAAVAAAEARLGDRARLHRKKKKIHIYIYIYKNKIKLIIKKNLIYYLIIK